MPRADEVEDFALGEIELANGAIVRIACSCDLSAGQEAQIRATFYGTGGATRMRKENGSFFDFVAERLSGRNRKRIAGYPDEWGGRAAVNWVEKLAQDERFEASTSGLLQTAPVLDQLYGRA